MDDKRITWMIVLLVMITIVLRITFVPREIGVDSYFIHGLAQSISSNGYIGWTLNPLSLFGLYPESYAAAVPLLISEISLISGLTLDLTILIYSIILGLAAMISAYILMSKFTSVTYYRMLAAFIFSTMTGILTFTTWTTSSRGLFLVLVPIFIFLLLEYKEKRQARTFVMIILMLLLMMTIHRMYILLITIIAGYLITSILYKYIKRLEQKKRYYFPIIVISLFVILLPILFVINNISGTLTRSLYTNLAVPALEYLRAIGIFMIFLVMGVIILLFKKDKTYNEYFMIITMLIITPLLGLNVYGLNFFLTLIPVFIVTGIAWLMGKFPKALKPFFISVIIISAVFASALMQNWHPNTINRTRTFNTYMSDQEYDFALWLRDHTKGGIIGNYDITNNRFNTVIPCRIYYGEVIPLVCNYITSKDIAVRRIPAIEVRFWRVSPYEATQIFSYKVRNILTYNKYSEPRARDLLKSNNIRYYISDSNNLDGNMQFTKSVKADANRIYDDGLGQAWDIR